MSIKVMSMLWGCNFGKPALLLIAQKLADYANDDGTRIYPSKETVAQAICVSERSVQRYNKLMVEAGLLIVVTKGGSGPKDTTEYRYDMTILSMLHTQEFTFQELLIETRACKARRKVDETDDEQLKFKGDKLSPLKGRAKTAKGDTGVALRVTPVSAKGDRAVSPDPSGTIIDPPTQNAREGKSRKSRGKAGGRLCEKLDALVLPEPEQRVVELLIRPLALTLRPSDQSSPELWKAMAQNLKGFPNVVLEAATRDMQAERSVFPTIAMARQFCQKAKILAVTTKHVRQIEIEPYSEEARVWSAYLIKNDRKYDAHRMKTHRPVMADADRLESLMAARKKRESA